MLPQVWAWHGRCFGRCAMEPIDPQALASVRGGFAALLGTLLQAAPGIIQAIGGLSKGSGSGTTAPAQAQPTMAAPTMAAPGGAAPTTQMASSDPSGGGGGACRSGCDPIGASSVTNIIRIG
jgi:hypothetical protein